MINSIVEDKFSGLRHRVPGLTLLASAAITLLNAAEIAFNPGQHDSSIFMYVGEMWAAGVIPYVELFDNKPPGIFALIAIAARTHHTLWAVALIEFLFVMGYILTVRKILQICGGSEAVVLAGTWIAVLFANSHLYGAGNMTEAYMILPMSASMLAFLWAIKSGKTRYVFLAGLLTGVACMFKPFALSTLAAQMAFTCIQDRPKGRNVAAWIAANLAGAASAWIPVLIYFSAYGGMLEMLDASFLYNLHYGMASKQSLLDIVTMLTTRLVPAATMVACLGMGLAELRKPATESSQVRRSLWILTLFWFGAGLVLILAAGRGYGHYFMTLAPALGLAAALFLWSIEEQVSSRGLRLAIAALVVAPLVMASVPSLAEAIHDDKIGLEGGRKPLAVDVAAFELRQIAAPSNTLLVWGFEPWLFSTTHMRNALRYPTTQYIYDSPRSYIQVGNEILNGMRTSPPDFVVVTPWNFEINWPHRSDPVQEQFISTIKR
jgi:4-amino-4-deoxy-L-arabinose transferase-like glycosyltransferase